MCLESALGGLTCESGPAFQSSQFAGMIKVANTTLNAQNLEALGAGRLAELLIELSQGNATAKRRLRMELAGTRGTDALAKEVRNRIATMARSRSFVDWQGIKDLANDLDNQRRAIIEKVAKADPKEALHLLWA